MTSFCFEIKLLSRIFQAIEEIPILVVAVDNKETLAFMGIAEDKLEMLFITAQRRGQGIGRNLLEIGINDYEITEVCVNEQNPLAKGFYEHMGFSVARSGDFPIGNGYYMNDYIMTIKLS